ncbi:T9SS type A sorting domain-containing protein [Polaribacter cellanae]|uniref:T9SS type A sorting domain-containing protein n=1 Tax=Polaribacter cellanae TaxID=2818493 RepID=A0A975CQZ8_9FLAO|nr:T9SS type A sorting domain-containing protein [Polaribacter cellanae]QTE21611.1 T9SS type A sorting domain-containing protein [Polaribacter cellanae]
MKTKLLIALFFVSLVTNAQLRLIKDVKNYVKGYKSVTALEAVDNDIIISMAENLNPFEAGVYISNGTLENTYKLNGLENIQYTLNGLFGESYLINNEVFLFSNRLSSSSDNNRVFKINELKTSASLVAEADNHGIILRTNNNKIAEVNREYYPSEYVNFKTIPAGYNFFVKIFDENGTLEKSYTFNGNTGLDNPAEDINYLTRIVELFFWKGKYYFTGVNTQNRKDLYYFDDARQYKITKLHVYGNSNTAVAPNNFVLSDDFIYFNGLYRTWETAETGERSATEHGKEICFTNGTLDFGGNETTIPNFLTISANKAPYDGTRGYKALDTNSAYANSVPIYTNNNVVIYKDFADNKALKLIDASNALHTLIAITNDSDKYFIRNNKLYYLTSEFTTVLTYYLYEFNGNPNNVKKYQLPTNNGDNFRIITQNPYTISQKSNKVFFSGQFYNSPNVRRTAIISFDFKTTQFTEEKVFADDNVQISDIKRYNNGFVFKGEDDKIYSYNAEIRATQITPNSAGGKSAKKTNSAQQLTLNGVVYNASVASSNLATNEKLKIELLDTTSIYFKGKIKNLPNNSYAKSFYKITALNNSNHETTLTLSFNNTDFLTPITKESDVSLQAFENGNWVDLGDFTVDLANKKITLAHNFKANSALFIKNSAVLNVDNFEVSNANVKVFPNPSSAIINIQFKNNETLKSLEIYNIKGQKMNCIVDKKTSVINISTLSKGVYILKIKGEKASYSKRIIKN